MRVYVDAVMLLNFLVDLLLILATNRISGFPPQWRRSVPAAALGGIYGGVCLFPEFHFLGSILWRIISFLLIAVIAFGCNRSFLQRAGILLLLSMALGGIAGAMGTGCLQVLMSSAFVLWLLCRIGFRNGAGRQELIPVTLKRNGSSVNLIALKDTGNLLCDPLTGEPVLVADADVGRKLLGLTQQQLRNPLETMATTGMTGLRLIPYQAVGQPGSMLLAVRFRDARIKGKTAHPLVAFAPDAFGKGTQYQMLTGGTV